MKARLVLLWMLSYAYPAHAQSEYYLPPQDTSLDYTNTSHIVDESGNLYILSQVNTLGNISKGIESRLIGTAISKLSPSGVEIWQKVFSTAMDSLYYKNNRFWFLMPPLLPASQLFIDEQQHIVLPYCIYTGLNHWNIRRNALLTIDETDGSVISDRIFTDSCCSSYDLQSANYQHGSVSLFFAKTDGHSLLYENRAASVGTISNFKTVDTLWPRAWFKFISFDHTTDQYFIYGNRTQISVYDINMSLVRNIRFADTNRWSYINPLSVAFNKDCYVINYAASFKGTDSGNIFTTVLSKSGKVLSTQPSARYKTIAIDDYNTIWAIPYQNWDSLFMAAPVTILALDLDQHVVRTLHMGRPYTEAIAMSIVRDELIVTGTNVKNNRLKSGIEIYSDIFAYRSRLSYIADTGSTLRCDDITLSPNPTNSLLRIGLRINDLSASRDVLVSNTLGQSVLIGKITGRSTLFDLRSLTQGIYFIRVSDNAGRHQCTFKLLIN